MRRSWENVTPGMTTRTASRPAASSTAAATSSSGSAPPSGATSARASTLARARPRACVRSSAVVRPAVRRATAAKAPCAWHRATTRRSCSESHAASPRTDASTGMSSSSTRRPSSRSPTCMSSEFPGQPSTWSHVVRTRTRPRRASCAAVATSAGTHTERTPSSRALRMRTATSIGAMPAGISRSRWLASPARPSLPNASACASLSVEEAATCVDAIIVVSFRLGAGPARAMAPVPWRPLPPAGYGPRDRILPTWAN